MNYALPREVLCEIIKYLDDDSYANMRCVNKLFRRLVYISMEDKSPEDIFINKRLSHLKRFTNDIKNNTILTLIFSNYLLTYSFNIHVNHSDTYADEIKYRKMYSLLVNKMCITCLLKPDQYSLLLLFGNRKLIKLVVKAEVFGFKGVNARNLKFACSSNNLRLIKYILKIAPDYADLLLISSLTKNYKIAKYLLKRGYKRGEIESLLILVGIENEHVVGSTTNCNCIYKCRFNYTFKIKVMRMLIRYGAKIYKMLSATGKNRDNITTTLKIILSEKLYPAKAILQELKVRYIPNTIYYTSIVDHYLRDHRRKNVKHLEPISWYSYDKSKCDESIDRLL